MEKMQGKKLLILAGAAVHCKVVNAAKELGVYTIVVDYLKDSPAKLIADESWLLNITDVDAIVEKCKEEKIDGVLNFCIDPAQIPYQIITEKLGLPCYGTKEQFHILTNKIAFKKFCNECVIDTIPEYTEESIKNDIVEYPIFIKPSDSRGSRGQSICYSKKETVDALSLAKKESSNGQVVIEKYMGEKQDFSMTYFVCNGEPYLTRTCDRYLGRIEDNLNKQCIAAIAPSKYSEFYIQKVDKKIKQFIKTLSIKNGPVFMQGFIDNDTIRFYDPGLRFPGGETELFLYKATGVNLMKLMIEFALTGSINGDSLKDNLYQFSGMHSIQMDFTCKPGKIYRFIGLEEIKNNQMVKSVFTRYEVGEVVPNSGDVRQRVCEIGLLIDEKTTVKEAVSWVQNKFDVLDKEGNSMLISPLNSEFLDY